MTEAIFFRPEPRALILSEHPQLRIATIFLLYLSQGLPVGLFSFAFPAWLALNGASAAAVGSVLAMSALPWTAKLAYGPVMDRYAFLAMGRRRPWIIGGQLALVAGLLVMTLANPGAQAVGVIAAFAFAAGLASAVQDVAVDGMAVDILAKDEIETVNGFMFGGQTIGVAVGAGLGGYLAAWHGLPSATLFLAVITGAIALLVVCVRERPGERLLPWSKGAASPRSIDMHLGAFGPIMRRLFIALSNRQTLMFIPALITLTTAQGIFLGMAPLFSVDVLGWEKDDYSWWSSLAKLAAGFAAVLLFGLAASRWGAKRMFIACGLMFAAVAFAMLALESYWHHPSLLVVTIFVYAALFALRGVAAGSVSMRLCVPAVAATQFSVFMACLNLGTALGGLVLGWLDEFGGIRAMFAAMAGFSLASAAFALVAKVGR